MALRQTVGRTFMRSLRLTRPGALSAAADRWAPTRAGPGRGSRGWDWYYNAKAEMEQGKNEPLPFPENIAPEQPRPRVYFDLESQGSDAGRVVFELASDIVPRTCENFIKLCLHNNGDGVGYRGTKIHTVLRDQFFVGGDVDGEGGRAAEPAAGPEFAGAYIPQENTAIPHSQSGVLSMAMSGSNRIGSQFFVTFGDCSHLDGTHCAIGRVVEGEDVLQQIEGTFCVNGKPLSDIRIADSGVISSDP